MWNKFQTKKLQFFGTHNLWEQEGKGWLFTNRKIPRICATLLVDSEEQRLWAFKHSVFVSSDQLEVKIFILQWHPGSVCHNNSVLNHLISIMTRVLIMALFIGKFIVKFWISYEYNDFFSARILNIMTFPLNLLWSVWQTNLDEKTKRKL